MEIPPARVWSAKAATRAMIWIRSNEANENPSTIFLVTIGTTKDTRVEMMLSSSAIVSKMYEGFVSRSKRMNEPAPPSDPI
ncbi:hypothetical protein D3C76_1223970 [compost metagenome]